VCWWGAGATGKKVVSRGRWTRKIPVEERRITIATPAKLGVLSDTHASATRRAGSLELIARFFRRAAVDLILHAGDAGHESILYELEAVAPLAAVRGNADPLDLVDALPDNIWIEAGSRTILLIHGHRGKTALASARAAAAPGIDLIVFGHSHRPLIELHGQTILFNPGSPTERRWNPHFGIGLIAVSDSGIEPDLILFDDLHHLENVSP
jgi:putative phosphoesterase